MGTQEDDPTGPGQDENFYAMGINNITSSQTDLVETGMDAMMPQIIARI